MTAFNWLHITDLHHGKAGAQQQLWPRMKALLLDDLALLHQRSGPWHALFFTGDLVYSGSDEQFDALDEALGEIYARIAQLQDSVPALFVVPGNHDLVRPEDAHNPLVMTLQSLPARSPVRADLFAGKSRYYRSFVEECFAPYTAWAERHSFPLAAQQSPGVLPGEYSAKLEVDGLDIGVVALNTAYLQISSEDCYGKLALCVEQVNGACGGDAEAFCRSNHLNFLLTHHPPDWLDKAHQHELRSEIAPPGRFVAHLCGHMHDSRAHSVSVGGAQATRLWQASSLFGMHYLADGRSERAHGMMAGRCEVRGDVGELRLWARSATPAGSGQLQMGWDPFFTREEDTGATPPEPVKLRRCLDAPADTPVPSTAPQPPGAPYDPAWHVGREDDARRALNNLRAGLPAVFDAPADFGKSWLLRHVIAEWKREEPTLRVATVRPHTLERSERASINAMLQHIGLEVAAALGVDANQVAKRWAGGFTPNQKLTMLMANDLLPVVPGKLLLAIEGPDSVWEESYADDFFGLLRAWADGADERLTQLRLAMTVRVPTAQLIRNRTQSPFNLSAPICPRDLSRDQVQTLAQRYGLSWSLDEIDQLMAVVGGHPRLVRVPMYAAAVAPTTLSALLDDELLTFQEELARVRQLLRRAHASRAPAGGGVPGTREAYSGPREPVSFEDDSSVASWPAAPARRRVDKRIDDGTAQRLVGAGVLIVDDAGNFQPSYPLYRHVLGEEDIP